MLSKNDIKIIRSLSIKRYRTERGLFVAEGDKIVGDLLQQIEPKLIVATKEWIEAQKTFRCRCRIEQVSEHELKQCSHMQSPQNVLALFPIPNNSFPLDIVQREIVLMLDNIQDPGNLGTITRIADWFGIKHIICSIGTADIYNPKAIQATMGAIARVSLHYAEIEEILHSIPHNIPIYGTLLDGENIYSTPLSNNGIIVMGNEGNGISSAIKKRVTTPLLIPPFPDGNNTSESLNVAIATAIVCSEFRRRCY